jgi:PAS domain S-box-containing protein
MSMKTKTLGEKAETELQEKIESLVPEYGNGQSLEDLRERMKHLLHEVQVYEQELEIQNQELREAQAALEKSRDGYVNLFDFAPVGYVTLSDRGVIKDINLTAAGLLGRERGYLVGFPFIHFVAREDRTAFLAHLRRCRHKGGRAITDLLLDTRDGEALPVQLYSVSALGEGAGGSIRTAITDIRERKKAEADLRRARRELERRVEKRTAELREANELLMAEIVERGRLEQELRRRMQELAEADRHKDEFLAMLAHELRNPLAAIANAGEVLRRQAGNEAGPSGRIARIIKTQAAHLQHLLDDLLDVARVTRGKIVLHKNLVEVSAIVNQAVETHRALIEGRGQRLAVTLSPNPMYLDADPTRCVQIVGNLLHNAAKFTGPGGEITLTVTREDGEAVIRVRDNGAGIPSKLIGHIFDLFTQEDRSLARSTGGLGIGLALVRRLTEMHGGRVEAASPGTGQGSEFTVRLPVANRTPEARDCSELNFGESGSWECATGASRTGHLVVIVDDNADYADSLGNLLEMAGYETKVFYDGGAALQFVRQHRPDIVLLDIGMPGMDGYEVARRLRAETGFENLCLIAISGYGADEDRRRSREAGFDHHLVKPVDMDVLRGLLPR